MAGERRGQSCDEDVIEPLPYPGFSPQLPEAKLIGHLENCRACFQQAKKENHHRGVAGIAK